MKILQLQNLGATNLTFTIVAIISYITIYFGIIPHVALAIFQTALCAFLVLKRKEVILGIKNHLIIYGLLVVLDLITFFGTTGELALAAWAFSFAIAFYFTWIMYQLIKQNHEHTQHEYPLNQA